MPHLGEVYTRHALLALCLRPPPLQWIEEARAACDRVSSGNSRLGRPRMERISAFASWDVTLRFDQHTRRIEERGKVFGFGDLPVCSVMTPVLRPIFVRVDRSEHAERAALLTFVAAVLQASVDSGQEMRRPTEHVGVIRLFSEHTPCISCMAVFCQFCCLYPGVKLEVAFDVVGGLRCVEISKTEVMTDVTAR